VLDAIAIAGQIIVGGELGAGRPERAYDASLRMITLSVVTGTAFAVVLLLLENVLPRLFTSDPRVLAECAALWPILALLQPVSGAVFALDGILIGASDGPYIAGSMVAAFAACTIVLGLASAGDWGVRGVWAALAALILVRAATMGLRFTRRRWLVTGWA
jgi:Na+-driven multidrug efflux pump